MAWGFAVQTARLAGASVFRTTSSAEKAKVVQAEGADEAILYTQTDFAERVAHLTQRRGVDIVIDPVRKERLRRSLGSLAPFGHLTRFGAVSGRADPIDIKSLYAGSLKVVHSGRQRWRGYPKSPGVV